MVNIIILIYDLREMLNKADQNPKTRRETACIFNTWLPF